ncbi:hypothetical protein LTS08_005570 [Lithohypha guttulata]|uniref:uncharacterized protein n=1 Tax=Lithohypha guttulata TaxID=1690604 RepID=UPI002DDFFDF2|nr:hypothetical protein LTR51_003260 [Lithohypha guttulata]KAK5099855.1 hypothetical protein LTS08_005570 [Lithohypha guttulata]
MASTSSKVGHGLAKVLGIKLDQHNPPEEVLTRGESAYSVDTADTYYDSEPTTAEWLHDLVPGRSAVISYFRDLFPFTRWIMRYNLVWLTGDLVAGITVGCVVVPQSMAYARLAELPVEFGLYSSFMGVLIYWFFATSKDITIGPVAVMSTLVGNIVVRVQDQRPDIPAWQVASALAIVAGGIICFLGLIRCGWLVEFIPLTAICAFMTGSAINIAAGQVPGMMGISVKGFNTRDSTYRVIINTLRYLGHTKLDAAMGLSALVMLYLIRGFCNFMARKQPQRQKAWFFTATLRTAFVLLLYTMISWLVQRHHRKSPTFKILGKVPRGFQHAQVPVVNSEIISLFVSELPATVIVLLIEHIAISKSFGRINNYTIDPSQELVAIGVTNLLGPFLGGYPSTGSFSRTAIKSKAGVRTPLAGVITAVVVLLAIYALTAVFFYIPSSALSAVIIHAVLDLITPPNTVYQFWRVNPLETIIFFAGVLVTIFTTIENGIYTTVCISVFVLLFRVVKARGQFVGKVKIHSVIGDQYLEDKTQTNSTDPAKFYDDDVAIRDTFLPIDHTDGSNPSIQVESPYPGVFIYRFTEGFNYPNANHYLDYLSQYIFQHTRRTNPAAWGRPGDRPWNNPGPRRGKTEDDRSHLPTLKAVILDLSAVNNVDVTSIQILIDVRNQLQRYAAPDVVQWHFASVRNRWTKRALASAGFGFHTGPNDETHRWTPIFSVAEIGGSSSAAAQADREAHQGISGIRTRDEEANNKITDEKIAPASSSSSSDDLQKEVGKSKVYSAPRKAVVHGLNRPFFHLDLTSALQAAIANVEADKQAGRTYSTSIGLR